jgi:hypothetical protein
MVQMCFDLNEQRRQMRRWDAIYILGMIGGCRESKDTTADCRLKPSLLKCMTRRWLVAFLALNFSQRD